MNNKIKEFRRMLAESGIELTLEHASDLYAMASKMLERSKKMSQLDLWKLQELKVEGMTEEEKEEAVSLYQHIRDLL